MKSHFSFAIIYFIFGIIGIFISENQTINVAEINEEELENAIPLQDRIDLAWQQEFEMTKDPALGYVPRERLYQSWYYMKSIQNQMNKTAIAGIQWTERGPNNQGGRSRAICVDLNDVTYKTVWVGSVGGGLWKTTDITATAPAWTVVNDFFQNLAITSISQDPVNKNNLYFSTGESSGNIDAVRGMGVWKSADGGNTWNQLASTNNSNFYYSNKIFVSGNDTVFVCTKSGLFRSVNGGTAFTKVLGTGISSAGGDVSYDIEKTYNGTLYATTSNGTSTTGTMHKSYDKGATWTTPLALGSVLRREIQIGISNNDTSTIWGLVENASTITAIIKSTDAGLTFTTTTAYPVDADGGIPSTDFSRTQGWYDLSIAVDPNNSSVCYVGGVDLFKTANGGTTWTQVSHWYGGFGFPYVHADQHIALYSPGSSSIIYFGCDGGIFYSSNATSATPTLADKGTNYNTAQFYGCAIHPTAGTIEFLAGAQDNGSHKFTSAGINSTTQVTGGDGAFCHIDQNEPQFQFTSYVYNSYYTSTNSGSTFSSSLTAGSSKGRFINPTDYDDINNKMYAAYTNDTFLRWENPQTGTTYSLVPVSLFGASTVSTIKVSPSVNKRVYFGTGGGRVVRVDSAHLSVPVVTQINSGSGMPASYVSCIEVDSLNDNHVLVCFSNYGVTSIWETKNGGTNWTSVEGNLPDMPIRWILLNPTKPWQALIATELGVWSTDTLNGTSTAWAASNTGLSNVRVDMLQLRRSDKMVIAATHGRGLFSSDVFMSPTADFTANKNAVYINKNIQFTSASSKATTYSWNFGDATSSTLQNPIKSYTSPGIYTITLTINSGASSITKTNFIQVLPYRGIPYTPAMGGNFESNFADFASELISGVNFERGSSAISAKSGTFSGTNAWVTSLTATTYASNNDCRLYTPSFNLTAAGTYTIKFYAKNSFELNYDGYRVEYSLDGGNTWTPLATTTSTGWYDYANTSTGRPFTQNQAFFNSLNSSYTLKSYNISSLAGNNNVSFRFIFKSDANTETAGLAIDDFEIQGPTNLALPVSLISFTGNRINKNEVELNWATASENNNKGFEIQRKINWNDDFETLTFISGKTKSQSLQNYLYTDENNCKFNSFYRLVQIDQDGSKFISDIIIVKGTADLKPNLVSGIIPSNSEKHFEIILNCQQTLHLKIISNNGQLVYQKSVNDNEQIDLTRLSIGVYYFKFESTDGTFQVEKVFVR